MKALAVIEAIVYAALLLLLVSGKADGVAAALPLASFTAQLPALLLIAIAIAVAFLSRGAVGTSRFSVGVAVLSLAAVFMAQPAGQHTEEFAFQPGYALYFAAVIMGATSPKRLYGLGCWGVLFGGEMCHRVISVLSRMEMLSLQAPAGFLMRECGNVAPLLTYAFFAGLFTHVVFRAAAFQRVSVPVPVPMDRSAARDTRVPAPTEPPRPNTMGRETGQFQAASLDKTQSFSVDYLASLRQTSEEGQFADLLSSVVYFMSRNFQAYSSLAFVYDPGNKSFVLNSFHSRSMVVAKNVALPLGKGVVGKIGTEKHSFMSGDLTLYSQELGYYTANEMINSVLAVPIISEQHELLGALVLDSKDKNTFSDMHKDTLKRFSALAAALITNHRMRFFQERTARQFQIFYQASQQFTTALKIEEVYEILMQIAGQFVHTTRLMVTVFDANRKVGVIQAIRGAPCALQPGFEFPINTGLYSYAFQKRTLLNIPDMRQHHGRYFRFVPEEPPDPSIGSLIILPMVDDESRCFGLLSIESDAEYQFAGDMEPILSTLVGNASVALNRALLYRKMEMLATTDGLTGLSNHRHFQEQLAIELERSKRYGQPVSLMLMDIDHFKSFNDTYGHTVGDLVLKEIAAAIKGSIRRTDFPARYGGEEFVVIMPVTDQQHAIITCERVRQNIEARRIQSMDRILNVTVSIGYDTYAGQQITQPQLINNADTAMYQSKETGRNRVTQWAPGLKGKGNG
jgi:diguanylate cyclase (GGDEF)-like protein